MADIDYLSALESDGAALSAAARGHLDRPVPSCPGWSVADLVAHTGQVHRHKLRIVRDRLTSPPEVGPAPGEVDLVQWYDDGLRQLLAVLSDTDPDTAVWSWFPPDQTAGFWRRRMAQETLVHRVDAELAVGGVGPVDPSLSLDGIDEVLDCFLSAGWEAEMPRPSAEGCVQISSGGASWRVALRADSLDFSCGEGAADATVSGAPDDVLLWLWGRYPESVVTVDGDVEVVRSLRQLLAVATE
jgi:uncharacterized protein (TIGR03083 family)